MSVEVRSAGEKGRGLFATRFISTDERFSRSPCLALSSQDLRVLMQTNVIHYCFVWPSQSVLALGDAAMCNASPDPNARAKRDGDTVVLTALRGIQAGEEITLHYRSRN